MYIEEKGKYQKIDDLTQLRVMWDTDSNEKLESSWPTLLNRWKERWRKKIYFNQWLIQVHLEL